MRFRSKPVVVLSIVLVLASALGGWHAPDDVDEFALPTTHQRSDRDARWTSETPRTAPEHCALCHWLQALGKAAPVSPQALPRESSERVRAWAHVEHFHAIFRIALPSRAPPIV